MIIIAPYIGFSYNKANKVPVLGCRESLISTKDCRNKTICGKMPCSTIAATAAAPAGANQVAPQALAGSTISGGRSMFGDSEFGLILTMFKGLASPMNPEIQG